MSDVSLITDAHRSRLAIVYVRQSTPTQLEKNHESRARQYALRERAVELGWPERSVSVVDGDLGTSGASTAGREGFKELVAQVGLGQVGMVLALEVSRFARSSADWHQLLDLCALTGTLIADQDGIYSPANFNDRLLLGLKGTMSEAELHLIRARLDGGLRNKAKRGELRQNLPVGFDRDDSDLIVLAADEQVRDVIGRVYSMWRRLGSCRQVVIELVAQGQLLPRRTVGEKRIRWKVANYAAVHDLLTNPAYAGAFVFGRTRQEKRLDESGRVRRRVVLLPIEQWSVCLPNHHPGYVTWDEYLATLERLRSNVRPRRESGEGGGAAREGAALLQGILRCGRCGRRMHVSYGGKGGNVPRYSCVRAHVMHGSAGACQSVGGTRFDRAVADAFLEAISPAGVRASADAVGELERQHTERLASRRLAVERAQTDADRARRQYDACEPENRLVARTLESRLEDRLVDLDRERRLLAEHERRRPAPLTVAERQALSRLARDLPRLWNADTTTSRDRKELLRVLVQEVVVTVREEPRRADIEIHWEGGARTDLTVKLSNRGPETKRTNTGTVELIRKLAVHQSDQYIAAILNKQGRRTGTGLAFNATRVKWVRNKHEIPAALPTDPDCGIYTIEQAAEQLKVSTATIYRWLRSGLLAGEQTTPHAAWRIRLTDEVRRRFVPDVPDDFLPLNDAAKCLGIAKQTVLHKVQRGDLEAVQVTSGRRKGLRIRVPHPELGLFDK